MNKKIKVEIVSCECIGEVSCFNCGDAKPIEQKDDNLICACGSILTWIKPEKLERYET